MPSALLNCLASLQFYFYYYCCSSDKLPVGITRQPSQTTISFPSPFPFSSSLSLSDHFPSPFSSSLSLFDHFPFSFSYTALTFPIPFTFFDHISLFFTRCRSVSSTTFMHLPLFILPISPSFYFAPPFRDQWAHISSIDWFDLVCSILQCLLICFREAKPHKNSTCHKCGMWAIVVWLFAFWRHKTVMWKGIRHSESAMKI